MTRPSLGLAIAVLFAASTALAVALRYRPGTQSFTAPAGSSGEGFVDVLTTADYYGLQVLTLWDHQQRVCAVQLEQRGFATATDSVMERVKVCEPKVAETWRRADVGESHFITAIAACVGGEEGVVRGVEILGAELSPEGLAQSPDRSARFAFESCAWSETRSCPPGQIATGVRVHVDDDTEKGIVGLSLRCHRLEPR